MYTTKPICSDRIRNIRHCTFGWIDHNFLHHGFLNQLSQHELLLYYFLITVADRNGVSFYDYQRICQYLKLELNHYLKARNTLCERLLIAFDNGVFQVLALPAVPYQKRDTRQTDTRRATEDMQSLKDIFKQLL